MDLNYEEDLKINKYKLDEELVNQPLLFDKWGKVTADAKTKYSMAWERVKIIKARLIKEAKGTAQEKEAFYRDHAEHKKAKQEMINAEHDFYLMEKVVMPAFAQRNYDISTLVTLWAREYFSSEPLVKDRPSSKKLQERRSERARSKVRSKRIDRK